jgi:hypothetical protein
MLERAVKAGASWEQIAAARGISTGRARRDYREWAEGQHSLLTWTEGRTGVSDAEYAQAIARASDPQTRPGGIGDSAGICIHARGRILCAHTDQDGRGCTGRSYPARRARPRPSRTPRPRPGSEVRPHS